MSGLKDVYKNGNIQKEDAFGFNARNEDAYFGGIDNSPSWNSS